MEIVARGHRSIPKWLNLLQEIGAILYVGGILSHIVIGVVLGHPDALTAYHVALYKKSSAYILIIPGLTLKILCDFYLYFQYKPIPNWFKLKIICMAFLTINAFVFLVPMMSELVMLAESSIATGEISQEFLEKAHTEQLVGMSNVIPLLSEIILGAFKPKLGKERSK